MKIRALISYITAGFVFGIIVLIVIQYVTRANVNELISGNESLLEEYRTSNELVVLQKDLLLLDNKIKSVITTGDSNKLGEFKNAASKVRQDVVALKDVGDSIHSSPYLDQLDHLVGRKLDFSRQLVDSFYKAGTPESESLIANHKAIRLSEEITSLTHKIDTSGRVALAQKVKLVDSSGERVLRWNLYIVVLIVLLLTAVFLIIVSRMRKQVELINQLNTSEKKLKEAALIKENFLANMSHEIRTPLNAILGYTHLLQKKRLDQDSMLHIETVHQSGETLLSIVNDILDLSKIESGMMRIEEAPFNLPQLIQSVAAMFHHKVEEKSLTFKTIVDPAVPHILVGDATRLTQVLVNLIGNALKFTDSGEIKVLVKGKKQENDIIEIQFEIADTGIGIEKEKLETIFERFRQAEDSTTRKYGGTGLGLAIVRDLVYLQNGDIELKSKVGVGTSVRVMIPYKVGLHFTGPLNGDIASQQFLANRKVLIVEDNVINQSLMTRFMEGFGVESKIATNGLEAISFLESEAFDLVFMDIQMPEMDGYAATEKIRNLHLKTPIVAMTAHAMPGEREKCMSFGMNEHITKPIREGDLRRIFSMFLDESTTPQSEANSGKPIQSQFQVIDLQYMKEISDGDSEYEKLVTLQFLTLIPEELASLSKANQMGNVVEIRRIAHNMKTSVSIMGIDQLLAEDLDDLENEALSETQLEQTIEKISAVCREAYEEANVFYKQL